MSQQTLRDYEYGNHKRATKREEFLDLVEEIADVPAAMLVQSVG